MLNAKRVVQAGLIFALAILPRTSQATSELHKNVPVGLVTEKNSPGNSGRCTALNNSRIDDTHELGHYTGLDHGGAANTDDGNLNCKPHYVSVMNYNYGSLGKGTETLPAFSRGWYKNLALNPLALHEDTGLGDNGAALDFLHRALALTVNESGGVDWNGNGVIESGPVQGALNMPAWRGGDCDTTPGPSFRRSFDFGEIAKPSLVVERDALYFNGIINPGTPALLIGMQPVLAGCAEQGAGECAILPSHDAAWIQTDPPPGPFSPAAAGDIVVYADENGKLYFLWHRLGLGQGGGFSSSSVIPVGGPAISGDPVAIQRPSGLVTVYAPSEGYLRRWDYDPKMHGFLVTGVTETLFPADGGAPVPIDTNVGIGLTWGYQLAVDGEANQPTGRNLYAAILTTAGSGVPHILLARLEAQEDTIPVVAGLTITRLLTPHWIPLGNPASEIPFNPTSGIPLVIGLGVQVAPTRIGLAFRPEPNAAEPNLGRFYVTWQLSANVQGRCYPNQPYFAVSRGNYYSEYQDISPTGSTPAKAVKTLVFDRAGLVDSEWTSYDSGASLVYFQGNVRGVYQTAPRPDYDCLAGPPGPYDPLLDPESSFLPNVDGIFFDEHDHDDVSFITSHLSWALKQKEKK